LAGKINKLKGLGLSVLPRDFANLKLVRNLNFNLINYWTLVIIKLIATLTSKKVYLSIKTRIVKLFATYELVTLVNWESRLTFFKYKFSTIFFLDEFLAISLVSIKSLDFTLLIKLIQKLLKKLTIWEHKRFFNFIFYFFKYFLFFSFDYYNVQYLKLKLKGKLGLTGNARKRIKYLCLYKPLNQTTNTRKFNLKAYYVYELLVTTSGAVGLTLRLFYF